MALLRVPRRREGPRARPDVVLAEKACSSRVIRDHPGKRGIRAVIPVPADRRGRLRRGNRGGRPPTFDRWRGIVTRCEKTATIHLSAGHRVPQPPGAGQGAPGPAGRQEPLGDDRPRAVQRLRVRSGRALPEQPLHRPRLEDRRLNLLEPHRPRRPLLPRVRHPGGPAPHHRLHGMGRRQRDLDRRGGADDPGPASPGRSGRQLHLDRHNRRQQPATPRVPGIPRPSPHRIAPVSRCGSPPRHRAYRHRAHRDRHSSQQPCPTMDGCARHSTDALRFRKQCLRRSPVNSAHRKASRMRQHGEWQPVMSPHSWACGTRSTASSTSIRRIPEPRGAPALPGFPPPAAWCRSAVALELRATMARATVVVGR